MFLEFASEMSLLFLVDGRDDLGIFVGSIGIFFGKKKILC